jgi:hypothetical protein
MWNKIGFHNLDLIKEELSILPKYDNQILLQGDSIHTDPLDLSDWKSVDKNEEYWNVNLFSTPYINSIIDLYKLKRTRLMLMKPKTCYYWHNDKSKRLHIPIQTNSNCFLLVEGQQFHLPADGSSYIVDTTKKHTALNCSKENRIHLVGVL